MAEIEVSKGSPNYLLAALPAAESRRLLRIVEPVSLTAGQVLHQPGQKISQVYFPCGGLISLQTPLGRDKAVAVGVIGREGMIGLPALLGSGDAPFRAVAHAGTRGFRLSASDLRGVVRRSRSLADLLLRYAGAFLVQVAQSAACRSLHPIAKRYCYWILMAHDRIGSDQLPFNQKLLAHLMAVRLASVTEAAGSLQDAGIIRYTRGGIHILDRPALEAGCCHCYEIIKDHFDRLLA